MPQANSMEVQNVTVRRPIAGMIWRWRTELGSLAAGAGGFAEGAHCLGLIDAGVVLGAGVVLAGVLPWPRRWLTGWFRCLLSRHRIQTVCWELRLHTRAYRLPLVLWIRPTPVGECAWILARAGMCADDFITHAPEIASACAAREARVTGSRRFAPLITVNIIRRDLLAPRTVIPARLPAGAVSADWLALPDDTDPDTVPAQAAGWPSIGAERDAWS
jgi:hypothetical protein